jgi:hypothetical protein
MHVTELRELSRQLHRIRAERPGLVSLQVPAPEAVAEVIRLSGQSC